MINKIARTTVAVCSVVFTLFIGSLPWGLSAYAGTYPYITDPRDGATIFYFTTTTNSITLNLGSCYFYGIPDWPKPRVTYYDGENSYTAIEGVSSNSSRQWISHSMTGLIPGTSYTYAINGHTNLTVYVDNGDVFRKTVSGPFTFTTELVTPGTPVFNNITPNSAYVSWASNGNGSATSYILQRANSASGPWSNLVQNTKTMYFQDSGLTGNTTYYYKVVALTSVQAVESAVITLTTATDPAIAAATAAKNSADLSMIASQAAQIASQDASTKVVALQTSFNNFISSDMKDPVIASFVYSVPKATITSLSTVNYSLIATDKTSLQYRYKINDGAFTGWTNLTAETVSIALGSTPGIKRITMQVMDTGGNIVTATATIFKI